MPKFIPRDHDKDDLATISRSLFIASEFGLEAEVLLEAFKFLKQNPLISISDALDYGLEQWIK